MTTINAVTMLGAAVAAGLVAVGQESVPFVSTADCDVLRDLVLVFLGVTIRGGLPRLTLSRGDDAK